MDSIACQALEVQKVGFEPSTTQSAGKPTEHQSYKYITVGLTFL